MGWRGASVQRDASGFGGRLFLPRKGGERQGICEDQRLGARVLVADAGIRQMVKGKAEPRLVVKPVGHFQAGAELDDVTAILAVALFVQSNGGVRRQHPVLAENDAYPQPKTPVTDRKT